MAESFANSRDTSFEQHVLLHTQGKGEYLHSSIESNIIVDRSVKQLCLYVCFQELIWF